MFILLNGIKSQNDDFWLRGIYIYFWLRGNDDFGVMMTSGYLYTFFKKIYSFDTLSLKTVLSILNKVSLLLNVSEP